MVELISKTTDVATTAIESGSSNQAWAVGVSAFVVLVAALIGVIWQRRISRQTLTFNTLMDQLWDGDYITQRQLFIKIRDGGADELIRSANIKEADSDKVSALRSILNNYELLALGVHQGVLDEKIYKQYLRQTMIDDFERSKPYITALRKRAPKVYIENEKLYEKWRDKN